MTTRVFTGRLLINLLIQDHWQNIPNTPMKLVHLPSHSGDVCSEAARAAIA